MMRPLTAAERGRMRDRVAELALSLSVPREEWTPDRQEADRQRQRNGSPSMRSYMRTELHGHLITLRAPADLRHAVVRTSGDAARFAPTMAKLLRWLRTGGR